MLFALVLAALSLAGIIGTARALRTDGYRAIPTRRTDLSHSPGTDAPLSPRNQPFSRQVSSFGPRIGAVTERG